jgi:hypothetical protein
MDSTSIDEIAFLLYVLPLNKPCITALKYSAATNRKIQECDVNLLKSSRPSWLTGVPTLLDRKTKTIYRGTHCLRELQNMCIRHPVILKKIQKETSYLEKPASVKEFAIPAVHLKLIPDEKEKEKPASSTVLIQDYPTHGTYEEKEKPAVYLKLIPDEKEKEKPASSTVLIQDYHTHGTYEEKEKPAVHLKLIPDEKEKDKPASSTVLIQDYPTVHGTYEDYPISHGTYEEKEKPAVHLKLIPGLKLILNEKEKEKPASSTVLIQDYPTVHAISHGTYEEKEKPAVHLKLILDEKEKDKPASSTVLIQDYPTVNGTCDDYTRSDHLIDIPFTQLQIGDAHIGDLSNWTVRRPRW